MKKIIPLVVTTKWQTAVNLITVPFLFFAIWLSVTSVSAWWLVLSFAVYSIMNISVAVGYHQLFTHQSFKTSRFWEVTFAILGTLAFQGSPLAWTHLHHVHHRTSDTEKDPHTRSLWFFLFKWYRKVDMPPSLIVKRAILDPLQRFLHFYGLLLCLGVVFVLWVIDPLVLLYGYLVPVGYFFLAIACHQIFTHVGNTPRNVYWLIPIFPWGDWLHKPHHETPGDWRRGGWCLSYYLIPLISR
jgi:stearoyl-CoA desaturase (delta-9 desaturase)